MWRPSATFTENERRWPDGEACNGQLPYHCTPERFEGWKPSKTYNCSLVISLRTVSKPTPGTVVPHSPTAWLGAQGPFRSLSSPEKERERSPDWISRLVTDHESMVTSVQIASSREVTSRMRRSIRDLK